MNSGITQSELGSISNLFSKAFDGVSQPLRRKPLSTRYPGLVVHVLVFGAGGSISH